MLFQFAFLLPTYLYTIGHRDYPAPSSSSPPPSSSSCGRDRADRPARGLLPVEKRGEAAAAGSYQPFEDVKTQSLSVARESEEQIDFPYTLSPG